MKVLLVYPYFLTERGRDYDVRPLPIGIYYIAAVLRDAGIDVDILNLHDFKGGLKELKDVLSKYEFEYMGVSLFNGNRFGALDCAKVAKELKPDVKVIFGGVGATFLWRFFLRYFPFVDFVIRGEGEETFLELIQKISSAGNKSSEDGLYSIRGIAFRDKHGHLVKTPGRGFIHDLDSLPDPSRFFKFQHVLSSRGCPWDCTFCGSPRFWKRRVRFHSPRYFVDQLERLYSKGIDFFYVSDDTFTLKKERVIAICKEILARKLQITWYAISRVNCVDRDILYWMSRAGCVQVSYGVESGSETVRRFYNKQITDEEIKVAFDLTRRFGMIPRAYFIYGAPCDNKKTIDETIDLMRQIKPLSMVSYILDLYPGTKLYEDFKKRFQIGEELWLQPIEDLMYFEIDPRMNRETVLWMGRRLKQAYYSMLPEFFDSLEFEDLPELKPKYSAFLARVGFTFTHGDHASNELIKGKDELAERLFKKALYYDVNPDAYLGLAVLLQRQRRLVEASKILREGLSHFPESQELNICLGLNYMNSGDFQTAIRYLSPYEGSPEVDRFLQICRERLQKSV